MASNLNYLDWNFELFGKLFQKITRIHMDKICNGMFLVPSYIFYISCFCEHEFPHFHPRMMTCTFFELERKKLKLHFLKHACFLHWSKILFWSKPLNRIIYIWENWRLDIWENITNAQRTMLIYLIIKSKIPISLSCPPMPNSIVIFR